MLQNPADISHIYIKKKKTNVSEIVKYIARVTQKMCQTT